MEPWKPSRNPKKKEKKTINETIKKQSSSDISTKNIKIMAKKRKKNQAKIIVSKTFANYCVETVIRKSLFQLLSKAFKTKKPIVVLTGLMLLIANLESV